MFKRLFDFSAEKTVDEAFISYFVYALIEYYITVAYGLITYKHSGLYSSFIPFVLNTFIAVSIVIKKG